MDVNSNHARDKIIRQGEAVTLNQVIEILQTEESTHSTMQQIQGYDKKSTGSIYYYKFYCFSFHGNEKDKQV